MVAVLESRERDPLYSSPLETTLGIVLPSTGGLVCAWIEMHCVWGEGDWYGQPVRLQPFQRWFIWRLYEYYPADYPDPALAGRRRYRMALWGMGKGNGKTPMAACIAAYELAGGSHVSPLVLIAAASLKQADLVFGDLKTIAEQSVTLAPFLEAYSTEILLKGSPGAAERIAAAEGTNDGPRATCFIADELHEWLGRIGKVFRVVSGAVAKRKDAFILAISTAGIDDEELELKIRYDYGVKVASGEVIDDAFLMVWYEADSTLDLDDPLQRLEAIYQANPAAGIFNYIEGIQARFNGAAAIPRSEWWRYHGNRWVKGEEIWELATIWRDLAFEDARLDPELPLFVGIDVGIRHDSSAVVGAQVQDWLDDQGDDMTVVVLKSWIWENPYPPEDPRHDGWTMDLVVVSNVLRELRRRFGKTAREIRGPAYFYDKTFFEDQAVILEGERLNMLEYPQTDVRMIPAAGTFLNLGKRFLLAYDPNDKHAAAFARHIGNVTPHEKPKGFRISKPRGSRRHIDAAVAAAIATAEAVRPGDPDRSPGIRILTPST